MLGKLARVCLVFALSMPECWAASNAFALTEAIYTTDQSGTTVNENIFPSSTDVYISGGPQNTKEQGLTDGTYYFQVTDPSGATLLSSDRASCRQLVVSGGRVAGASPTSGSCRHASGTFNAANGTTPVQLAPFTLTPSAGLEYKAWLIAQTGSTSISLTDPRVIIFSQSDAKTDNFKAELVGVPPQIASCKPISSLTALIQGANVTAYVPNGAWASFTTGIQVVPIKPAGTPASISTRGAVNSCAANASTGQTVCTANSTDLYLITGSTLNTTLTSGATAFSSFSGGTCQNCGVTINRVTNTAVLAIGLGSSPSGDGLQLLNLANNAFSAPIIAVHRVSEDLLWDPGRNLILSPGEGGVYDLFDSSAIPASMSPGQMVSAPEYGNRVGGELDSASEDCLTGIALSSNEINGSHNVFIADLTQAKFFSGSPAGTWTAGLAQGFVSFPEFSGFAAGRTGGISVAPGSHLAIVTAEFGGNQFGVLELPATSGTGVPAFVDYAAATLPATPDGFAWSEGNDPHTVTAYIDPTNGKAFGLMADSPPPHWLAVVDLQAVLNAPRTTGTHFVLPSYNLITNGVVTYYATH